MAEFQIGDKVTNVNFASVVFTVRDVQREGPRIYLVCRRDGAANNQNFWADECRPYSTKPLGSLMTW